MDHLGNVSRHNATDVCQSSDDVHGMGSLLLMQAIVASITSVAAVLLFKRAPPTPPSASASQRNEISKSRSPNLNGENLLFDETQSRTDLHWKDALKDDSMNQIKQDLMKMIMDKQFQKMIIGFVIDFDSKSN